MASGRLMWILGSEWFARWRSVQRRRRKLRQELEEFRRAYQPKFDAAKDEDTYRSVEADYLNESRDAYEELQQLEWSVLARRAYRLGISVPGTAVPLQSRLARRISDARFHWWSRWVGFLSPPLSLLVSLGAVLAALS